MTAPAWIDFARAAGAAETILAGIFPGLVQKKRADPLDREGYDLLVRRVALRLLDAAVEPERRALDRLRRALDTNWSKLGKNARARKIEDAERLIADIAAEVSGPVTAAMRADGRRVLAAARAAAINRYKLPIRAALGQVDERVIDHAANAQALFLTDHYGARAARLSAEARRIVAAGLEGGFDSATIGQRIEAAVGASLGRSSSYYPAVASIFVARARSWGLLSSFEEAGIERFIFSAVMDEATCFAAGTRVLLADGQTEQPIETIQPGTVVMSCCGRARPVVATIRKAARKWGEIVLDGPAGPIIVTHSHGFLTSKGWIRANALTQEDQLAVWTPAGPSATAHLWGEERAWGMRRGRHDARTINVAPWPHPVLDRLGFFAKIRSIRWAETWRTEDGFDLEVAEDAGYIAEKLVVHNSNICRFLDGQVFSVGRAAQRFRDVAENDDPRAVVELQPFVAEKRTEAGIVLLAPSTGYELARIEESALGKRDARGSFSSAKPAEELEAAGVTTPPLHGYCRSDLLPA